MDPLSALGLASNIISFIDFASNLVKDAANVYQSASGLPAEVHDAVIITESLESYMARLSTATLKPGLSVHDKALASLVQDCQKTCVELQQLVRKIKSKAPGSRTESFRVAWRALRRKGKLEELEKRLDKIQSQILSQLVFMLRNEHRETHGKINSLNALEEDRASEIQHVKQEILTMIQSGTRQTQEAVSNNELEHRTVLCEIRDAISKMSTAMKFASGEKQIRDILWFPELETRFASIEKAHGSTYRWLLHDPESDSEHGSDDDSISVSPTSSGVTQEGQDQGSEDSMSISSQPGNFQANESQAWLEEPETSVTGVQSETLQGDVPASAGVLDLSTHTSVDSDQFSVKTSISVKRERVQRQVWREQFLNWLQDDNGLFYISGKPGSGKSTLMKSICQDPHSQKLLRIWANKDGKDLLYAGNGIEKSCQQPTTSQ
ncbi:hypothetical protein CkaCkLH20_01303 [Colletotrichum karsti]|uniref:Fungal N-terminal domain-containing protein n=1 Tax=Colletotrichum karsti TaxID=1095194 RepID=A0A9P6ICN6_9PEZI|nr:uncharacterized protein CkaCkLH20_01303 [Colletotrichum karsti]KAF9881153.1 hypothetical protein CkaCkLH20_01303 [Colletotrichum karsti]